MTRFKKLRGYLKPLNYFYYCKAKWRKFITKQYSKIADDVTLDYTAKRIYESNSCFLKGSCKDCGCDFIEMIRAKKECNKCKTVSSE